MEVPWRGIICLTIFSLAQTYGDSTCKSGCRGAGGPFLQGNVYKYQLEGSTVTHLPGSPDDVTSLGISATAEVFAESNCQHVLKLSNVQVKGPDGKAYDGLSAGCAKPIKFSYNDGKLEDICSEADDKGAALNIKRAVISLLSSSKKKDSGSDNGYENDVFGICPTDFSFSKEGTKLAIQKSRNLNRCALREEFNFPFPTTPYQAVQSSFGAFETSPLFGAQLTVKQELDNNILQKATGEEVYTYTPLVNQQAGIGVKVSYTLTLQSSSAGSIPANVNSPKKLYYESAHTDEGMQNKDTISAALQKATAALDPIATPQAAKEFANLVYVIEQGSKSDILQAYTAAQGKTAKNLFLDGLLYAGSSDSVEAAAELLSSKKIPEDSALRWYLDLHFVKHTSQKSLASLLPLLGGDKVPPQAYLGIGAVAGKYCLEHRAECDSSNEFKALVAKLAEPLVAGCKADSHDKENTLIASLKGLRNVHHLPDNVAVKVSQCATDKSARTRVRVAAIETFHADANKSAFKQAATSILKNVEEDSELRIKAYLALVESPCPKVADTIKELVDNEPINQVGSFVVSHLRNLRASVSPEKEAAKQFLGNIISKKKYPIDQRKFSRNYEVSYSLDALNVGAVGEVSRIFSQKSFIPRSVSLNLTTQLFGQSVNLAEVGLRAENLERIVEKYFGPKGLVKTNGVKLFDSAANQAHDALKKAADQVEAVRPKRSVNKQQAEDAANKIELGPDYEDLHTNLDLSVKLFGSDIAWLNYYHDKFDYDGLKKKFYGNVDESLDKSKSIDIDYKKARTFLDVGVAYPTGLGFGLKVKVNGNSAVNVKVNGKVDVKAIINNPKNAHIAFQLVPSASVELKSLVVIDADVVETGLKVSANLHSSTGSDLTIKVLDGYGIDVKLGLPVKNQEIIDFNSDIVSIVREKKGSEVESPIKFNVKRQDHGGCFDQLNTLTGLTVCGEVSLPMDGFKTIGALYGPSKATLRLEKDDSLTAYHFKAFYDNKQPDKISVEVLLDTPNSKTDRKFALIVQGSSKPQKQIKVNLASPFKQASFDGFVTDNESEQSLSAKLLSDGSEYSLKVGAHVSQDGNRKKYEPLLEFKYPESAKSEKGWLGRKGGVKGGKQQPQTTTGITGAVYVEKTPGSPYRKYELKAVTLTTPKVKLTVDGVITIDANLIATDLKASYDKDTFQLNSKIQKLEEHKYIAKIDFMPSQYPDLGASIKWEYERGPNKLENILVVVHGPDLKSEVSRLSLTQSLSYKYESVKIFDFHTENTVSYPLLAISASVKGGATPKSLNYDIDVTYDKNQVKSKLDATAGGKNPSDYSIDFEAKALGNSIDLFSKHESLTPTKSKFTNSLELKPGGKYQLNAIAEFNAKAGDVHQSLNAELRLPQDPKIVKLKTELKHNGKENEVEFELIAGNKHIVDIEFEVSKVAEPSGKFKVLLLKYIDSQGSFDTNDGKATGSFHINIMKTGRKIEGSGEVTKTDNHIKGSGDILWDAKKDPNKKLHVETDTSIVGKSIDSKNSFQILDKKTDINVKGSLESTDADGTLIGDAEIVLPNGRILGGKLKRVLHIGADDNRIEETWELLDYESRGAQPRKVGLKVAAKNINPARLQFDGQVDLTYLTPTKEDLVLHAVGKKVPQGDKWAITAQGSITGSLVKYPLQTKLNSEISDQLLKGQLTADKKLPSANYDFELNAGSDIVLNANGKINQDQFSNEIALKLPADLAINSVKWSTANTLNIFVKDADKKIATNNALHWNGDSFVKFSAETSGNKNKGNGKLTWESHTLSARTLTYKASVDEKNEKLELDLALQWEGKVADFSVKANKGSNPVHVSIVSNVPNHGKLEIDASHKVNDGGEARETLVSVTGNDKKLVYSSRYSTSKTTPYVDLNLELPQGKSRFYVKLDKKEEKHALVESKLNWFTNGGGSLDLNGDINVKSLDDLSVKLFIDSPKLNLNKVQFEAANEPSKSAARTFAFHGKTAEYEFSGSLALTSKGVLPNLHYEGKGSLKIGENTYPLEFTFKNEREQFVLNDASLVIKAGKYSYTGQGSAERDGTGKAVKLESLNKFCVEADCKSDELKYNLKSNGLDKDVSAELKFELIPSFFIKLDHPIIFNMIFKNELWQYDSITELVYGPKKLQYHEFLNKDHAGFELTLPKRVVAAEVTYEFKTKNPMSSKIEGNFWLDKKNSPSEKTSLLLSSQTSELPQGLTYSSEARFNTPGLKELTVKNDVSINQKDHVITAKLEADVFAKKNQKLVVDYKATGKKDKDSYVGTQNLHIHSKGLNIESQADSKIVFGKASLSYSFTAYYTDSQQAKREAVAKLSADRKSFSALVKIPEATLYSADVTVERAEKQIHAKGKYEVLGYKFEEDIEVKGTKLKMTIRQINENNPQLDIDIGVTPGQIAEVSGKFNNKPLVSAEVALDEAHFLKSKHTYNTDTIKELVTLYKENAVGIAKEASRVVKETGAKIAHEATAKSEELRKGLINIKPAVQYYQKELQQFKEEVKSNQNVQDVIDFITNTFGTVFKQIGDILEVITNTTEKLFAILNDTLQKVNESVKASIPKLKENYEKASQIILQQWEAILNFATSILNSVLDKIKEHEKEIQDLTSIVTDSLHDIGQLVAKTVGELQKEVTDFINVLWDQIQALPAYNMLKEKLQEFKNYKIPDQFWDTFHEMVTAAEQVLPTPELQQLLKSVAATLEKILKHEPINRSEVLQQLYNELVAAIRSVVAVIEAHKPEENKVSLPSNLLLSPVPSLSLLTVPPGTFRLSLFNWVRSPDLPTLSELFHTYRPQHTPLDIIPPFRASAQLIGGTEFFTFDRKHYSFKGSCSYILTNDIIDGNFSIVANMEAGKLKSIAAYDHENIVELLHDDKVLVNGQPSDLPVKAGDLHMWRNFDAGTGFATWSGIMFFCTTHLKSCAFSINGFYFGKTRGLLGTYNNEPYDDVTLPNGKLAQSTAQFANAWKVSPQCADAPVQEQLPPPTEECTNLFSGDTPLRRCFPFHNPDSYREACNKQVIDASAEDKQDKACNVALSYVGYCHYVHFVNIKVPDYCGKCQLGSQSLKVGESAEVKTPQKEADVVFVVEQLKDNEEVFKKLVSPLISSLTHDFKEKGITDVKFALIGYGAPEQHWPATYTFNGKYNEFTGSAKNIYFEKEEEVQEPKFSDKLHEIKKRLQIETGTSKTAFAFKEAFSYPFRPAAVKTIVGITSSGCASPVSPLPTLKALIARLNLRDQGIVFNLVTPLDDLTLEGKDEKAAANVVGFDSYSVYTQSEAKRKVLKGDEEAFNNLKYTTDLCVDMALGSDGAVFSSTNFIEGKPGLRKNFLQVLSNKIIDSVTEEELKEECKCELDRGMIFKTKCKVIGRKQKEALTKGGVKGVKG